MLKFIYLLLFFFISFGQQGQFVFGYKGLTSTNYHDLLDIEGNFGNIIYAEYFITNRLSSSIGFDVFHSGRVFPNDISHLQSGNNLNRFGKNGNLEIPIFFHFNINSDWDTKIKSYLNIGYSRQTINESTIHYSTYPDMSGTTTKIKKRKYQNIFVGAESRLTQFSPFLGSIGANFRFSNPIKKDDIYSKIDLFFKVSFQL